MQNIFFLSIFIFLSLFFTNTYAEEPILITHTGAFNDIIFDGKWTDSLEWKESTFNKFYYNDDTQIILRTAHQENFIYVHLNVITDTTIDKGSDSATICFDTKNDKTIIPQKDDYCFFTTINGKNSFSYQGGSPFALNGHYDKIINHKDYIAIGTASDKNDRYIINPHPSYEFKIPLELLGRSDNYGFYFSIFDATTHNKYSWPTKIQTNNSYTIPSPNQWGDMISPDKSLPEFNFSILFLLIIPLFIMINLISKNPINSSKLIK